MDDLFDALPCDFADTQPPRPGEASPVFAYLQAHPGWHGKEAILSATGYPDDRCTATVKALLAGGQVERQGERRGARYRWAGGIA
jgi:hypothetical protein